VASAIGYVGVADRIQLFAAGTVAGLVGCGAALLMYAGLTAAGAAAVVVSVVMAFAPTLPLLAIRLGRLPMPALPTSAEDLMKDPKSPPRARVYAAVVRADEMLTGMLVGTALVACLAQVVLVRSGDVTAIVLVALVAVASLLRARLFPTVRQRLPLLLTGLVGLVVLTLGALLVDPVLRLAVVAPALAGTAGLVAAAGLLYSRRAPSPYLGRIGDILDVLLAVAVVPVAVGVLGLYGYVRGIGG
jgi:type VII secretion integral membrane protein EccD